MRNLSRSAFALFVLVVWGGTAVQLLFGAAGYSDWGSGNLVTDLLFAAVVTLFPVVGLLILERDVRNRVGWLVQLVGVAWMVSGALEWYTTWGLVLRPGSLPAAETVQILSSASWVLPVLLMGVYVVLLFPDGHLPGPRWRVLSWGTAVVGVLGWLLIVLTPGPVNDVRVPLPDNPLGVEWLEPFADRLVVVVLPLLPICVLSAAASLVIRYRKATGVRRLQLKWLMAAASGVAIVYGVGIAVSWANLFGESQVEEGAFSLFMQTLSLTSFGLIPIAIGIAVTRHGLYGIDALISRTLVIGALGVFITALYVGIVVGVGALIGQSQPSVWLSVLATALVAVLFQPVRERVHRMSTRLVYGTRATPYEVLSDFAASMAGRYTTRELLPRMAQTVSECLGSARVEVWLRTDGRMVRDVVWPAASGEEVEPLPLVGEQVPELQADRAVPVRHGEELLGLLTVTKPPTEPVTPVEDEMLDRVASQAGLVLRNRRLVDDLRGSRQRLVTSSDEERRRLERNLHDGAQQSLVSVALLLRMAATHRDVEVLRASIEEATSQLQQAIGELRELARGIHPAILTDRGLGPALTSLAERCPVPVLLDTRVDRRLPDAVEGALYFVVAEALTNVVRYAQAPEVRVSVTDSGAVVDLEVVDDGVGGADQSRGTGLLGLTDRVAVVDGTFTVTSPAGGGTRIGVRVPPPPPPPPDVPQQRRADEVPVDAPVGSAREAREPVS